MALGRVAPLSSQSPQHSGETRGADYIYQDMHLSEGFYEIIGTVRDDKTVRALTSIELGENLGMWFPSLLVFGRSCCPPPEGRARGGQGDRPKCHVMARTDPRMDRYEIGQCGCRTRQFVKGRECPLLNLLLCPNGARKRRRLESIFSVV